MGGRSAEEIFLGHITTGAGNDIERATDIARKMVCDWGMSDLGPLAFGKKEEAIFLGREIAQHRDYSEDTAIHIDDEVRKIVTQRPTTPRATFWRPTATPRAHRAGAARTRSARCHRTEAADGRQAAAGEGTGSAAAASAAQPLPGVEPKPAPRPELRPAPGFSKG